MNRFVFAGSVVIGALALGMACSKVDEPTVVTSDAATDATADGDAATEAHGPRLGESTLHYVGNFGELLNIYAVINASGLTRPFGTTRVRALDVTADGSNLAVLADFAGPGRFDLFWVDPATDTRRLLATANPDEQFSAPRFSPDGKFVACHRISPSGTRLGTLIASVDGTSTRSTDQFLSWAPDSKNLLVLSGASAAVIAPDGGVVLPASSLGSGHPTAAAGWLDPTRVLYRAILDGGVAVTDGGGTVPVRVPWLGRVGIDGTDNTLLRTLSPQGEFQMSPDGKWVLNQTYEVFAADGSGSGLLLGLTSDYYYPASCTFSPDSTKVACMTFTSDAIGTVTVRRIAATGLTVVMTLPSVMTFAWAPTSDALAVVTIGNSSWGPGDTKVTVPSTIALVSLEASPRQTVLVESGFDPGRVGGKLLWRPR